MMPSRSLPLIVFVVIYSTQMRLGLSEKSPNNTCHLFFVDLQKPNGNCEIPVIKLDPSFSTKLLKCPESIRLSWLHRPPFVSSKEKNDTPTGTFVDLIQPSLTFCCRMEGSQPPNISYDALPATSLDDLHEKLFLDKSQLILPLYTGSGLYTEMFSAVDVLSSPGEVLLLNKSISYRQNQHEAWRSLIDILPVILLSILLAGIAGICVWALDTRVNPEQFPRPFSKGAREGFWWAFVTMTTVGYGDRTPKSFLARVFAVTWIVVGLALCSIMTASITTVLTSINVDKEVDVMDKNVAVLRGSPTIANAVKNGANPKAFRDFESMYQAMTKGEVDGILMEKHMASFAIRNKNDDQLYFAKYYPNMKKLGFAFMNSHLFSNSVTNCLKITFKARENDVDMVVNRFLQNAKKKGSSKTPKNHHLVNLLNIDSPLFIIITTCFAILFVGCAAEQIYRMVKTRKESESKADVELQKCDS